MRGHGRGCPWRIGLWRRPLLLAGLYCTPVLAGYAVELAAHLPRLGGWCAPRVSDRNVLRLLRRAPTLLLLLQEEGGAHGLPVCELRKD